MKVALVDTSLWTQALRQNGDPVARERLRDLILNGRAAWCEIVRVELWRGTKGEREVAEMKRLDESLPRLSLNPTVYDIACDFAFKARRKGLIVPPTDMIIFACAIAHEVELAHADHHFDFLAPMFQPIN